MFEINLCKCQWAASQHDFFICLYCHTEDIEFAHVLTNSLSPSDPAPFTPLWIYIQNWALDVRSKSDLTNGYAMQ